ncbi:MAG TPA: secretin N-terminal domain-containing protein, partial [Gemmatimonadales bacterium]|nr:secretin N-terminal domain-containing protein [Gemmatimonadales bacterium]
MRAGFFAIALAAAGGTLAAGTLGAQAAPSSPQAGVQTTAQGTLVDFQDADLRLVISALAEAAGLNVVYGDLPARRVTLRMRQPLEHDALVSLLKNLARSNGLTVVEQEGFLRIEAGGATPAPGQAAQDTVKAEMRLFVHRLKHARASELAATIQTLFGGGRTTGGRAGLTEVPLSQTLREAKLPPSGAEVAPPPVRIGVEVGGQRASLPGTLKGDVQIVADERTNALLVRAQPADWEILRQTIDALDVRPLQVLIEVVIAEVRRTRETGTTVRGSVSDGKTNPEVKATLDGPSVGDFALEVLKQGTNLDLKLALHALSSRGEVRILSRPVILAQNNQEARILIGSERPFVQASRSLPTDAGVRDQLIQYRDVGTKLTIVPIINDDGYVNLQVLQEVSSATAEVQFGAPIISTREASTLLFVRDGQTAVIGGLIDRQEEKSRSGIPVLMDIPLVGGLFGNRHSSTTQS